MPTPIETLIDQSARVSRFASNSRYVALPFANLIGPDGQEIAYVTRRFVPASAAGPMDPVHAVTEGERPDHLAAEHLGDPELYWRLCDHNLVSRPWELTARPGTTVQLPTDRAAGTTEGFAPL